MMEFSKGLRKFELLEFGEWVGWRLSWSDGIFKGLGLIN
jgi:hypothetical protein